MDLKVRTSISASEAEAGVWFETPTKIEPSALTRYPKLLVFSTLKYRPGRTDTDSRTAGSKRSCIGAARICSPEVTRNDTLKFAPALALAGPSHLSWAGPAFPGLSGTETPGAAGGTSFAIAEAGALGNGDPPCALSS